MDRTTDRPTDKQILQTSHICGSHSGLPQLYANATLKGNFELSVQSDTSI